MYVKDNPNPGAGVIHPAEVEDDGGMVVGYCRVASRGKKRSSDENSEGDGEHTSRLVLDSCQFIHGDFSIPEVRDDG